MQKVVVVIGPTASGKSDFAVALAKKINGEIISADSRQVYKGLDIGTGKITPEEMQGVPHHLLDVAKLGAEFSVAEYQKLARPVLEDILSRGKTPIICGGTGQYIDALIYDTQTPEVTPNKELRKKHEQNTTQELFRELKAKDAVRAASIDPHNKRRLIRALEIIDSLGHVPRQEEPKLVYDVEFYLMNPSREILKERIAKRLEKRLKNGMIDEVKWVVEQGYEAETLKKFGLEYVVISEYLKGSLSEDKMKEELINMSMQYARRQRTWNKKYLPFATVIEVQ